MPRPQEHVTDNTSLSLIERIRQRDDDAWRRLVELYGPLIAVWCRKAGLNEADAADVQQDVLAAVSKNIGRFRRDRPGDTFRGWLRIIARNKIRSHIERTARAAAGVGGTSMQVRIRELPEERTESPEADEEEQTGLYRRALDLMRSEFEESTWRAFVETAIHGRAAADVAADLGMTAGAVRQARYRVLRRLRTQFGEFLE